MSRMTMMIKNYDKIKADIQEVDVERRYSTFADYDETLRTRLENQELEIKQKLYARQRKRHTDLINASYADISRLRLTELRMDSLLCGSERMLDGTFGSPGDSSEQ